MHRSTRTAWQVLTALLTAGAFACAQGTGADRSHGRFAVAPPIWLTEAPPRNDTLQTEMRDAFAAEGREIRALSEGPTAECAEDVTCLAKLGADQELDTLVIARLARLGPTTLLRLQSVDVALGAMDHTLQSVIEDSDDARLAQSLRESSRRLARLYAPPTPWYRRPAVIAVGAAALVTAVTVVLLATRGGEPEPDVTVRPP